MQHRLMELRGRLTWAIANLPASLDPELYLPLQLACEECFRSDEYQRTSGHLVLGLIKGAYLKTTDATSGELLRKGRLSMAGIAVREWDADAPKRKKPDSGDDYLIYVTATTRQGLLWLHDDAPVTSRGEGRSPNVERFVTLIRALYRSDGKRVLERVL